jgi:hypothetical protein
VTLEVGADAEDGIRLDWVRFRMPDPVGDRLLRTSGSTEATVAVSNTSPSARRVAIALALFDAEGRLLGVASGGNRLLSVKPQRQQVFKLVFDGVNGQAHRAQTFQISVESGE